MRTWVYRLVCRLLYLPFPVFLSLVSSYSCLSASFCRASSKKRRPGWWGAPKMRVTIVAGWPFARSVFCFSCGLAMRAHDWIQHFIEACEPLALFAQAALDSRSRHVEVAIMVTDDGAIDQSHAQAGSAVKGGHEMQFIVKFYAVSLRHSHPPLLERRESRTIPQNRAGMCGRGRGPPVCHP